MKINEILHLFPAVLAGLALGTLFFGGLWLTVQQGVRSKKPAFLFAVSFGIRISITLAGFYFFAKDSWEKTVLCLAGFIIARIVVTRYMTKRTGGEIKIAKEAADET